MVTMRVSSGTIAALDRRTKEVREAITSLDDRRELLQKIKKDQANRWAEDFMAGGDPPWPPTSTVQQARRIKEGYSPTPTLIRSGATLQHFISQNNQGRVNAASIRWDFSNKAGAYTVSHHTGYNLGGSVVPTRQLWDIDPKDEEFIVRDIEEFVEERLSQFF